ncbi:hypothetical protein V6N11_029172 [Hibiscus sabdariffa]|uniref:Uncharacterized protein n=2 Tax=Hibiscus sabdariffa TaxID=183260 RepID=A0ABR2NRL8_9ROSI
MLGKHVWRLIFDPDALLSRVLCARYFPSGDIFEASCPQHSSFAWKGIFKAFQKLKPGFLRRPGIGSRIRIHDDHWGSVSAIQLYGDYEITSEVPLRCQDFMFHNSASWNSIKVRDYFTPSDADSILNTAILNAHRDIVTWSFSYSGIYSVRSGYSFLHQPERPIQKPSGIWRILSKLTVPPKVLVFGWRIGHNALPLGDRIRKAGIGDENKLFLSKVANRTRGSGMCSRMKISRRSNDANLAIPSAIARELLSRRIQVIYVNQTSHGSNKRV